MTKYTKRGGYICKKAKGKYCRVPDYVEELNMLQAEILDLERLLKENGIDDSKNRHKRLNTISRRFNFNGRMQSTK